MKKSTVLPVILLIYLAVMSYIGLDEFRNGHYLYYFGIIGVTLVVIFLLHLSLRRAERLREQRRNDNKDK